MLRGMGPGPQLGQCVSESAPHPGAGYLCSTESEYADAIAEVVTLEGRVRGRLAAAARRSAARFSDRAFRAAFLEALSPALPLGF